MRYKLHIYLLGLILLLLLSACESGSTIKVINRTDHPLYYKLQDFDFFVTIPANSEQSFNIDTGTQSIWSGEVTRQIMINLVGETFQIYNYDTLTFVDSTSITLKAGKTYSIYANPNRASIKIINNTDRMITDAEVYRHNGINPVRVKTLNNIAPGEMRFTHVNYSVPVDSTAAIWVPTPSTNFYYYVLIRDEDNQQYIYGGESSVLYNDHQLLINYTDASRRRYNKELQ